MRPVKPDAPPFSDDTTFSMDGPGGSLSVNVPRLYCETIGAPVQDPVMQYCLDRDNWRREQLINLARRIEELVVPVMNDKGTPETLATIEHRCRAHAHAMLREDDLTQWTPMDAERVPGGDS